MGGGGGEEYDRMTHKVGCGGAIITESWNVECDISILYVYRNYLNGPKAVCNRKNGDHDFLIFIIVAHGQMIGGSEQVHFYLNLNMIIITKSIFWSF